MGWLRHPQRQLGAASEQAPGRVERVGGHTKRCSAIALRRLRHILTHKLYLLICCVHTARVEAGAGNKASGEGSMLRRTAATATIAAGLGERTKLSKRFVSRASVFMHM